MSQKLEPVKGQPGLFTRGDTYVVRFKCQGLAVWRSVGTNLAAAKQVLHHLRAQAVMKANGVMVKDVPRRELYGKYIRHCEQHLRPDTVVSYKHGFKPIWEYFRIERIDQLKPTTVDDYVKWRRGAGVADATVRRELSLLKAMLNWAVRYGEIGENPLRAAKLPRIRNTAYRRALTLEEFARLLTHRHPAGGRANRQGDQGCRNRDLWCVFGMTGMRKGALIHLCRRDVDLKKNIITIQAHYPPRYAHEWYPKTRASYRPIPMSPQVREVIGRRVEEAEGPLLFTTEGGTPFNNNLNRKLTACMKAASITEAGICLHSLRHSFASWLDSLGVPHGAAQALMGHASRDMTFHYTHSFPQDRQAAVDNLGRAVKDAIEALPHERVVRRECAPDPESEKEVA